MSKEIQKSLNEIKKHWENPDTVSLGDGNLRELERGYVMHALNRIGKVDSLADIGCGDASDTIYWIDYAREVFGYDYSAAMIEKASLRSQGRIKLSQFDILKHELERKFDVILSKRCLINLGSFENQKEGILKIYESIKDKGFYIMLECCSEGLNNLNFMRERFDMEPIEEPFHNVYFELSRLSGFIKKYFDIDEIKFFSTYYFLTRIYNQMLDKQKFKEFDVVAKRLHERLDIWGSYIIGPQFLMVLKKKQL